jgi:hypothetical protein
VGVTYNGTHFLEDDISKTIPVVIKRDHENKATQSHYSINSSYNLKANSKLFLKIGVIEEVINLNLNAKILESNNVWSQYWNYNDYTNLLQGYAQLKYRFNDDLTLNTGIHSQGLALNNSFTIEPRVGLKYQLTEKSALSAGYGMHSQMQPLDVYFYRSLNTDSIYEQTNKKLGFTKSQHFVLGYDILPIKDWRIKTEIYYQLLSNIPVTIAPTSFSMLNTGSSFSPNTQGSLVNGGTGTNYGAEITIEKFFSKGYYALITGTLYQSKYKGSDGVEHNTAYNGNYVYNILMGKEFKVGKAKRNVLSFGVKMTQAGGRYYTPIDLAASQLAQKQITKSDYYAYSERNSDFYRLDIKTSFTVNSKKRKISQSISFDIQNITNNKNVFAQRYNPVKNEINTAYQIGFFPNFIYKIQF